MMDNFSVIASLMLFGLFLILSPSEGYVVGYIDFADQRMQSSLLKRQDQSIMNRRKSQDVETMYNSGHNELPGFSGNQIRTAEFDNTRHEISSNEVADNQFKNEIMYESDARKAVEGRKKKADIMLADASPKNENGNYLPEPNAILYVQVFKPSSPSKL